MLPEANSSRQCHHRRPPGLWPARRRLATIACAVTVTLVAVGCSETLDAGHNRSRGKLPIDNRNPIVLLNDGAYENWSGEYAIFLANAGGPRLAGIIVNQSTEWPDIQDNLAGYQDMVNAARAVGFQDLPDPIPSPNPALLAPASGSIADTQPNRSPGALRIVELSKQLGLPYRPLVIVTGGALTDVADAYLIDPTITQTVVVVSSLGSVNSEGGGMGIPNGDRDPWADLIVASQFQYIQVSVWYDQLDDVPTAKLAEVPQNELGRWITAKQPRIQPWSPASDQVSVLAAGLPAFVTAVQRASATGAATATMGPNLTTSPNGPDWIVSACDTNAASTLFWRSLSGMN